MESGENDKGVGSSNRQEEGVTGTDGEIVLSERTCGRTLEIQRKY